MVEMGKTMLHMFFPGVFLGFMMMPGSWLVAVAVTILAGVLFWRRSPTRIAQVSKAVLMASASLVVAIAFYVAAVWRAKEACSQPPPDGLCAFDGLPLLSLCALYLLIGLVAWIQWARIRRQTGA